MMHVVGDFWEKHPISNNDNITWTHGDISPWVYNWPPRQADIKDYPMDSLIAEIKRRIKETDGIKGKLKDLLED